MPPWVSLGNGLRLLVAAALVLLATVFYVDALVERALPWQRWVYGLLMPDFLVYRFELAQHSGHVLLRAVAVSQQYQVIQGQAYAPGLGLSAQTPARMALTPALLLLLGALALARGPWRRVLLAAALALLGAVTLLVSLPPLILAGQQWGTLLPPLSEPSVAALLVGLSEALLHGAGLALAAIGVVLVRAVAGGAGLDERMPPAVKPMSREG